MPKFMGDLISHIGGQIFRVSGTCLVSVVSWHALALIEIERQNDFILVNRPRKDNRTHCNAIAALSYLEA